MRLFHNTPETRRVLNGTSDEQILAMWQGKRDTLSIARRLGVPESYIANRLAIIRDRQHQQTELAS